VYEVFYKGHVYRLVWGRDSGGHMRAKDYFDSLDNKNRAAIEARLRRYADHGRLSNDTQFKREVSPTFAFKIFKHRIIGFRFRNDVVLIDGFGKKTDNDTRADRNLKAAAARATDWLARTDT
jgi:phage-related protein